MAGFLTNLGLAAGRNILYGQEFQERQAELDLRKQQVEMGKLALGNAQRQQQTQAEIGGFLQSEMQKDASNFTNPANAAKEYNRAAGLAFADGDFVTGNAMSDLAKGKESEARTELVEQQKRSQMAKDDLGDAAANYSDNPTPEGAKELVQKAIAAGVNPTTIPTDLQSPVGKRWVNGQEMASKSGRERLKFLSDLQEKRENRAEKQREFNIREQGLQQSRQSNAMLREAMLGVAKERVELEKQRLSQGGAAGARMSMRAADSANSLVGNAAEATRNIDLISEMNISTTNTPFSNLKDEHFLDAFAKSGINALTPDDTKMLASAQGGMVAELTNINLAGPGTRAPTQARIQEMHKALDFDLTDPPMVKLFKFANAADIARVRLKNTPDALLTPEARASKADQLAVYDRIPTPKQVYKAAQNAGLKAQVDASQRSIADVSHDLINMVKPVSEGGGVGLPGQGGGGGQVNRPPLPPGGLSSDDNALIDKYLK